MAKIIHPTIFPINGIKFQVYANRVLADRQALNIALFFVATHKVRKKRSAKDKVLLVGFDDEIPAGLL